MRTLFVCIVATFLLVGCRTALREQRGLDDLRAQAEQLLATPLALQNHCDQHSPPIEGTTCSAWLVRQDDPSQIRAGVRMALSLAESTSSSDASLLEASFGVGRLVDAAPEDQRSALASFAVDIAQPCGDVPEPSATCDYRLAQALGLQARERRSTALDALPRIIALLNNVNKKNEQLDFAGADRTLAWLYVRAPGWPTGPGDPDLGLEHAQAAVERAPGYAPNLLALGECFEAVEDRNAAANAYRRALEQLAERPGDHLDLEKWLGDARSRLASLE